MSFAWPAALLALSALAIPIVIHLLQRGQHRVVTVATTQFIADSTRQRWRKVALDHPLLLLLRCLLLIVAALLLAEPFTISPGSTEATDSGWTVVSPRVPLQLAQSMSDSGGSEWRWLAAGFPRIDQHTPAHQGKDTWSLIAEADARLPPGDKLTVVLPQDANDLGVYRPPLQRSVDWLIAQTDSARGQPPSVDVMVVYDTHRTADARWLSAVFDAWSDAGVSLQMRLVPRSTLLELAEWTVWLSDTAVPQTGSAAVVLTDRPQSAGNAVADTDGERAHWNLTQVWNGEQRRLNIRSGLTADGPVTGQPEFAELLLETFAPDTPRQPPIGYAVSASQLAPAGATGSIRSMPARQSRIPLFAVVLVLLWCAERLMSARVTKRRGHV